MWKEPPWVAEWAQEPVWTPRHNGEYIIKEIINKQRVKIRTGLIYISRVEWRESLDIASTAKKTRIQ